MMKLKSAIYIFYFNLSELCPHQKDQNNALDKLTTLCIFYLFEVCCLNDVKYFKAKTLILKFIQLRRKHR